MKLKIINIFKNEEIEKRKEIFNQIYSNLIFKSENKCNGTIE